jgi:ribonuclease BN (tRNA processing enzyme)
MRRIIPLTSLYCIISNSKSYSDESSSYQPSETKQHFKSEIIFLGTGSSSGIPYIYDLMFDENSINCDERDRTGVEISNKANKGDPRFNKDYRCNPSIIVRYRNNSNSNNHTNILFDCGKTFRESAVRWFPHHKINSIDSVILTHGHADAIFGIDDLRMTQSRGAKYPLEIYQSSGCKKVTKKVFSYLYPPTLNSQVCKCDINNENDDNEINSYKIEKVSKQVQRFVANINWIDMIPFKKFQLKHNFNILPIPVIHGDDCLCMGFIFGRKGKISNKH